MISNDFSFLDGELYYCGCNLVDFEKRFGSPLMLLFESPLIRKLKSVKKTLYEKSGSRKISVFYSVKTNDCPDLLAAVRDQGFDFEVVTPYELRLVDYVDSRINKPIIINGPNKQAEEIEALCSNPTAILNIDNCAELEKLVKVSDRIVGKIGIRVSSDDSAVAWRKFGVLFGSEEYERIVGVLHSSGLKISALHSHYGKCIADKNYLQKITDEYIKIMVDLGNRTDSKISIFNYGGGLRDFSHDDQAFKGLMSDLTTVLKPVDKHVNVYLELGKYLVDEVGIVVTTIGSQKNKDKKYVFLDVGTNLIGGAHKTRKDLSVLPLAQQKIGSCDEEYSFCGSMCFDSDVVGILKAPVGLAVGDKLCLYYAGAYSITLRWKGCIAGPQIVYVSDKGTKIVRERDSFLSMINYFNGNLCGDRNETA